MQLAPILQLFERRTGEGEERRTTYEKGSGHSDEPRWNKVAYGEAKIELRWRSGACGMDKELGDPNSSDEVE
jgi:hypothetical protein